MTRTLLLLAGCFASVCGWAGCNKPAETAAPSAVQVPNYAAASEASDADDIAALEHDSALLTAGRAYQDSVSDTLSRSPDPRDWAMAVVVAGAQSKRNELLARAASAAPNDVLVQWFAISQPATHDTALASLHRLEPDNAAVWLEDLIAATKRSDDAGIDLALAKMSAAPRFDSHLGDQLKALSAVYSRHPVPDEYFALLPKEEQAQGKDVQAFSHAMSAAQLPALQHLVNACRIDLASGRNSRRAADCAAVGRLMVARGDTLLANRIGAALLRASHTFTDQDLSLARNDDWIYARYMEREQAAPLSIEQVVAYQSDWIETNSEKAAMRLFVLRSGASDTPPEDWTDDRSQFVGERFRSDAEWFEKNPAK
jgi:hypothetical protein